MTKAIIDYRDPARHLRADHIIVGQKWPCEFEGDAVDF